MFKVFPDPIKEHDAHGFRVFLDGKGAQGGDAHQEIFVKYLAFGDVF